MYVYDYFFQRHWSYLIFSTKTLDLAKQIALQMRYKKIFQEILLERKNFLQDALNMDF